MVYNLRAISNFAILFTYFCYFQTEEDNQTAVALENGTIITVAQYKKMIAEQQLADVNEG